MAAVALIRFTQGANTDAAGKAVLGDFGDFSPVTVTNNDNTNVTSWKIYLLDAPPDSATFPPGSQPQILAQAATNTPTVAFTPDVAGTYRVMLEVSDGASPDRDIRCFGIPDARGFIRPPFQENPAPLPIALPGIITADPRPTKPDEQNYGANVRGWAGNGTAGQLDAFMRQYDDLPFQTVTTTPFTATPTGQPLYVVDVPTIGTPAVFNLPLSPRTGFVARVAAIGAPGDMVVVQAQGGGAIGSTGTLEIVGDTGVILVHLGSNNWAPLAVEARLEPFSTVLYVDAATAVPASNQDGSVEHPYGTLEAAIAAAAPNATVLVVPGDYSGEGPLTVDKNLTIGSFLPTPVGVPGLGSFYTGVITVDDVEVTDGVSLCLHNVNVGTLTLATPTAGAILEGSSASAVEGDGAVNAWNSNLPLPLEANVLIASGCQLAGSPATITLTGQVCDLIGSSFDPGTATSVVFSGAAGVVNVDAYTNYWIAGLQAGPGFTLTNGTLTSIASAAQEAAHTVVANVGSTPGVPDGLPVGTNTVVGRVAGDVVAAALVDAQVDPAAAIALSKLAQQAANSVVANPASGTAVPTVLPVAANTVVGRAGGDLVAAQVVTAQIATSNITNALLADMAGNSVKANATGSSGAPGDLAVGVNTVVGRVAGNIVAAALVNAQVDPAAAIALSKLAQQAAHSIVANPTGSLDTPAALAVGVNTVVGRVAGNVVAAALVDAQIDAAAAIALSKLAQQAANTIVANASAGAAVPTAVGVGTNTVVGRVGGDIVAAQLVTSQIANSQITNALLADMAANTIKANATAGATTPADLAVGTNTVIGRVAGNIVAAQLVTAQVANSQITNALLADMAANTIKANATAGATAPGDLAVGANSVVGRVAGNIVAAALVDAQIDAAAAIALSKLATQAANTVVANATAGAAVPTAVAVGANTVVGRVAGNIVAAQVVTAQIASGNITNALLANMAPGTVKGVPITGVAGAPSDLSGNSLGGLIRFDNNQSDNTSSGSIASYALSNEAVTILTFDGVSVTLHGIVAPASPGKLLILRHISVGTLTLVQNSTTALSTNDRFNFGGFAQNASPIVLGAGQGGQESIAFIYAGNRWQWLDHAIAAGSVPTTALAAIAANTVLANATAGSAVPTAMAIGTNTVLGRVAGNVVAAQVVTGQIADQNVTLAKVEALASDTFPANTQATSQSPLAKTFSSLGAASTSLAWDSTNKRLNYIGSSSSVASTPTGAAGVVNIAALECGGVLSVIPSSDANIDGFTAKADGFWFDLIFDSSVSTFLITLNENAGATTTSIRNPNGTALTFGRGSHVRIRYYSNRWRAIAINQLANAMLASMAANTVKANATAASATPTDVAVGTNTVLGRVAGNIVAAALVDAQIDAAAAIGLSKLATQAANTVVANATGSTAAVTAVSVGTNTVLGRVGGNIVAAALVNAQVDAAAAIALSKLAQQGANTIVANATAGSAVPTAVAVGTNAVVGRVAGNIVAAALVDAQVDPAAAIALSKLATQAANTLVANPTASTAVPTVVAVGANTVVGRVGGNIVAAALVDAQIDAAAAIALSKLAQQAANTVLANAGATLGVPTAVAVGANTVVGRVAGNIVAAALVDAQIDGAAAIALSKLATQAANSVVANATAGTAVPTAVSVGTNTVVGRVAGNVVAAQVVNSQVTGGGLGTMKGVALGGVAGTLQDLTGAQVGESVRFAGGEVLTLAPGTYGTQAIAATSFFVFVRLSAPGDVIFTGFVHGSSNTGARFMLIRDSTSGSAGRVIVRDGNVGVNSIWTPSSVDWYLSAVNDAVALQNNGFRWYLEGKTVANDALAGMAANTVKANATASLAVPTDVAVGTNTVLGRAAGNIVAAQVINAQVTGGTTGTVKGVAINGSNGVLQDLTGGDLDALRRLGLVETFNLAPGTYDNVVVDARTKLMYVVPTADGDVTITGLAQTGGNTLGTLYILKEGSPARRLILAQEGLTSTAGNRFWNPGGVSLTITETLGGTHVQFTGRWITSRAPNLLPGSVTQGATLAGGSTDNLALNADTTVLRLTSTTGAQTLTGMTGGVPGRMIFIENVAANGNPITLASSTTSLAANQFRTPNSQPYLINFRDNAIALWDATGGDWRILDRITPNDGLAAMTAGTVKGRQIDAGTGVPVDLTGAELAEILRMGTVQTETGALPLDITLNADATFLNIDVNATGEIRTLTGSALGRVVLVTNANFGTKTIKHNFSAGTSSAFITPGLVDFNIQVRDSFLLIGLGATGWQVVSAPLGLGRVGTAQLANDAVDNTKLTDMAVGTVKGRALNAGSTGDPQDLTGAQVAALVSSVGWSQIEEAGAGPFDDYVQPGNPSHILATHAAGQFRGVVSDSIAGRLLLISHQGAGYTEIRHNEVSAFANRFFIDDVGNHLRIIDNEAVLFVSIPSVGGGIGSAASSKWVPLGHVPPFANTTANAAGDVLVHNGTKWVVAAGGNSASSVLRGNGTFGTAAQVGELIRYATIVTEAAGGSYAPYTLGATANHIIFTATSVVHGLTDGAEGREVTLENGAAFNSGVTLTLVQFSSSAGATNQKILLPTVLGTDSLSQVLMPGACMTLRYIQSRWRAIHPVSMSTAQAANTVLANASASTGQPLGLAIGAGQVVGRTQTGNIAALTGTNQGENLRWGVVIDTAVTGTVVSYAPAGYTAGTQNYIRVNPAANATIRGMNIASGAEVTIRLGRTAAFTFTLTHEDALANANEAFNCPGSRDVVLRAGDAVVIRNSEARNNVIAVGKNFGLRKNSTGSIFSRGQLNLIEGPGISLDVADDATDNETDITVTNNEGTQEDGPTAVGTYEPTLAANTRIYRVNPNPDVIVGFTGFAFTGGNTGKAFLLVKQGLDGQVELKFNAGVVVTNGMFVPGERSLFLSQANSCAIVWYQTFAGRWNIASLADQYTPYNLALERTPPGLPAAVRVFIDFSTLLIVTAGVTGVADDVEIFNANAPVSMVIKDVFFICTTTVASGTVQLRSATAGGGSALSSLLSAAAPGTARNNLTVGMPTVVSGGSMWLRRSDRAIGGQLVITCYRF